MQRAFGLFAVALSLFVSAGCGHGSDRAPIDPSLTQPSPDAAEDLTASLRAEVRKRIEISQRTLSEDKQEVIHRAPYWYKEYAEFPDGSDTFEVETAKTESRTAPMTAVVTLNKVRFSTRLHRDRAEAVADENFLRDTGTERLNLENRNGRWILNGGTYVAERSEELIAGQWVPVEESTVRTVATEEKPGWFGRTWATLTGR